MRSVERLFVLWSETGDRRYIIGELWRTPDGSFAFAYVDSLADVESKGFRLLPEFPMPQRSAEPYLSTSLFSTFAQRIPSTKRPDRAEIFSSWGIEHVDDPLEILAVSGGIQLTDRLELAEYRTAEDQLDRPLTFRLAGSRFHATASRLQVGDELEVRVEPENRYDQCATVVLRDGTSVGYVPRQYSALVAGLLRASVPLEASVIRRLIVPEERGRWIVRLRRKEQRLAG